MDISISASHSDDSGTLTSYHHSNQQAADAGAEAGAEGAEGAEKKEKKEKKVAAKREIVALPGEHLHIKIDKGVKVSFS